MRPLPCSLAAAVLLAGAGPAGAAPTRVAVADLDAPPELTNAARSVADAVARRAAASGWDVLGPAEVEARLGREGRQALARCGDDARCLADRGAKLGVDHVVGGLLSRRGAAYRVTLVRADARTGARLAGAEREIAVASRRLQRDVEDAVPGLLAGGEEATGVLRVVTEVPGALVTVDGAPAGRSPLARVLRPGRHEVRVELEGYAATDPAWVEVQAGGIVEHRARLHRIPAREVPNASPTEGHGTAVQVVK